MELQFSVQDLHGVRLALENQIDRVELSSALDLDGLTPSIGMVEKASGIPSSYSATDPDAIVSVSHFVKS